MKRPGLFRRLLPLAVLMFGIVVAAVLIATPPAAEREPAEPAATLVETRPVRYTERRFSVTALGIVRPAQEVMIQPQVGGLVTEVSQKLVPGGRFEAGELLFRIEPTDYRIALETRRTQLAEAEAQLALEQGRQAVARREWALFSDATELTDNSELALREPQLRVAEAAVAAARAQLEQAEVNLARTTVRAPFSAVVRSESVDLGQTLSTQSQAARLVGTDLFRVQVSLPVDKLAYIDAGDASTGGAVASVSYDSGVGVITRQGRVAQLLSDLDPRGQMARVVVEIDDPLALQSGPGAPPLLLDSYVEVSIDANRRGRVVELQREFLRSGDRVWLVSDGRLEIRPVQVAWRLESSVLVDGGLEDGDLLVVSNITTPVAGMALRIDDAAEFGGSPEETAE